jgi:uncharacterized protein YndB with AHSA1/START domain
MTPDTIEREITIAAPPQRVWELITTAEHLGTWFGDAGAEIDLRPGGAMELRWAEMGTSRGRVEAVEPPERFAFWWAPYDGEQLREPGAGNETLVEFTLAQAPEGTLLRVVESGFSRLVCDEAQRERARNGNVEGWAKKLEDLRRHALGIPA